jgi:hypothetical protein
MDPERNGHKQETTHIVFRPQDVTVNNGNQNMTDTSVKTDTQLTNLNKNKVTPKNSQDQNTTIHIGYFSILILLVFVVGMLLMLYFFYNVMSKTKHFSLNYIFSQ